MNGFYIMPHPPLLIPEVGREQEQEIIHTFKACEQIGGFIAANKIDTIILVSPHGLLFEDAVTIIDEAVIRGDMSRFGAPEVSLEFPVDRGITGAILAEAEKEGIPIVPLNRNTAQGFGKAVTLDHGALVPLYFAAAERDVSIVHLTYGLISEIELYRLGMLIRRAADESARSTAFIASGDLSHRLTKDGPYPYSPRGTEFDALLVNILESGEFEKLFSMDSRLTEEAGQCGLRSILMLCGAMDGRRFSGNCLSYEGPFGVGYAVMEFTEKSEEDYSIYRLLQKERGLEREQIDLGAGGGMYAALARKTLEYYFAHNKYPEIPLQHFAELAGTKSGVFVCLKSQGRLRGCIGTILPVRQNIGEEIIYNSVSAALHDPRFPPVRRQELPELDITVDVLSEPEAAQKDGLDPALYGVIVSSGSKKGVLLPALEGVDTVDRQLEIALEKAGIGCTEPYRIQRFTVTRYAEKDDAFPKD